MTPRLSSIRKIFHTSQRARVEWVNVLAPQEHIYNMYLYNKNVFQAIYKIK